jgi:hypothetical protein
MRVPTPDTSMSPDRDRSLSDTAQEIRARRATGDALVACYDRVAAGGFVIVDDYGAIQQCALAVADFRAARGITEAFHTVDWTGVYWRNHRTGRARAR